MTVELIGPIVSPSDRADVITAWRFAAAAASICPVVALLGAKRPQDRAWQCIVFSLWVILVLPSFGMLLLRPGSVFEVHWLRKLLLAGLIAIGFANYAATRFAPAALCAALGQACIFTPYWSELSASHDTWVAIGTACITVAVALCFRLTRESQGAYSANRAWKDFRDIYGAAWALRVADRVNALSAHTGSNIRLSWGGITSIDRLDRTLSVEEEVEALERSLRSMLRRFVSDEWLERRTKA